MVNYTVTIVFVGRGGGPQKLSTAACNQRRLHVGVVNVRK